MTKANSIRLKLTILLLVNSSCRSIVDTVGVGSQERDLPNQVIVVSVRGNVELLRNGEASKPVVTGLSIKPYDVLGTSTNGSVEVRFLKASCAIQLAGDTVVAFEEINLVKGQGATRYSNTTVSLKKGRMESYIKRPRRRSQFIFKTDSAVNVLSEKGKAHFALYADGTLVVGRHSIPVKQIRVVVGYAPAFFVKPGEVLKANLERAEKASPHVLDEIDTIGSRLQKLANDS